MEHTHIKMNKLGYPGQIEFGDVFYSAWFMYDSCLYKKIDDEMALKLGSSINESFRPQTMVWLVTEMKVEVVSFYDPESEESE